MASQQHPNLIENIIGALSAVQQSGVPNTQSETERLSGLVMNLILQQNLNQMLSLPSGAAAQASSAAPPQRSQNFPPLSQQMQLQDHQGLREIAGLMQCLTQLQQYPQNSHAMNPASSIARGLPQSRPPLSGTAENNRQSGMAGGAISTISSGSTVTPAVKQSVNEDSYIPLTDKAMAAHNTANNLSSNMMNSRRLSPKDINKTGATAAAKSSKISVPSSAFVNARSDSDDGDGNYKSKTTITCPARKMPWDHNRHTAYFKIVPGVTKHGDELRCSYESCCEKGNKFLYCKFCHAPVSKRHFPSRHLHHDEVQDDAHADPPSQDEADEDKKASEVRAAAAAAVATIEKKEAPCQTRRRKGKGRELSLKHSKNDTAQSARQVSHKSDDRPVAKTASEAYKSSDQEVTTETVSRPFASADYDAEWEGTLDSGLQERPAESISPKPGQVRVDRVPSDWKQSFQNESLSDDDMEYERPETLSTRAVKLTGKDTHRVLGNKESEKRQQLKVWNDLLDNRPPLDDRELVTEWLFQLLNVSAGNIRKR